MENINLEDCHEDVLAKAMRGLCIGKNQIAKKIEVNIACINSVLSGEVDEEIITLMAGVLKLDKDKLLILARKEWAPIEPNVKGVKQFNQAFDKMWVNAYIAWDSVTLSSWLFDTGSTPDNLMKFINANKLQLDAIFLTHTHRDHIYCLDEIKQNFGNPKVFVHKSEPLQDSILIEEGFSMNLGRFSLKALHTHGHSAGGLTYLIEGLPCPVAVVGDALFAGSMGGGMVSYQDALRTNREKIMTLPDNCVLCPGHGPMTTVGEEKKYNPFFPEF